MNLTHSYSIRLTRHAASSAASPSERGVKVMLGPNWVADRHVFWLERVDPTRPTPDDDDELDQEPAPQPLPPAADGAQ